MPWSSSRRDAILPAALVWTWALTGAFFWALADRLGAVLPQVPTALWAGPGLLWRAAPWALVALLVLAAGLVLRPVGPLGRLRGLFAAALAVVVVTALVWGAALLQVAAGAAHR